MAAAGGYSQPVPGHNWDKPFVSFMPLVVQRPPVSRRHSSSLVAAYSSSEEEEWDEQMTQPQRCFDPQISVQVSEEKPMSWKKGRRRDGYFQKYLQSRVVRRRLIWRLTRETIDKRKRKRETKAKAREKCHQPRKNEGFGYSSRCASTTNLQIPSKKIDESDGTENQKSEEGTRRS